MTVVILSRYLVIDVDHGPIIGVRRELTLTRPINVDVTSQTDHAITHDRGLASVAAVARAISSQPINDGRQIIPAITGIVHIRGNKGSGGRRVVDILVNPTSAVAGTIGAVH